MILSLNSFFLKKKTVLQILNMEKYFLEKYYLLENEDILSSFNGNIILDKSKKYIFNSRIFITNIRIIVLSDLMKIGGGSGYIPWAGLVFNLFMAIDAQIKKKLKSSITKSVEGLSPEPEQEETPKIQSMVKGALIRLDFNNKDLTAFLKDLAEYVVFKVQSQKN